MLPSQLIFQFRQLERKPEKIRTSTGLTAMIILHLQLQPQFTYELFHIYYIDKSVLLGTKPLVDNIRHFIQDPSGVFPVCHLCECRIVH